MQVLSDRFLVEEEEIVDNFLSSLQIKEISPIISDINRDQDEPNFILCSYLILGKKEVQTMTLQPR